MTARSASTMARPADPVEPVEPREPLGTRRHVFVLKTIGARHDESIESAQLQLRAQSRHARLGLGAVGALGERLEMRLKHGGNLVHQPAKGKPVLPEMSC